MGIYWHFFWHLSINFWIQSFSWHFSTVSWHFRNPLFADIFWSGSFFWHFLRLVWHFWIWVKKIVWHFWNWVILTTFVEMCSIFLNRVIFPTFLVNCLTFSDQGHFSDILPVFNYKNDVCIGWHVSEVYFKLLIDPAVSDRVHTWRKIQRPDVE